MEIIHSSVMTIGIGFDIHRLAEGRKLILGGVPLDYPKGLVGHSDGDVVLHAIADALLGAAGLGDIGELFPDTDPRWKDISSAILLADVAQRITGEWEIENIDVNIIAEAPKLGETKRLIKAMIADILHIPASRVNVKAKTMEGLGEIGAKEAIACHAAVSLIKRATAPENRP